MNLLKHDIIEIIHEETATNPYNGEEYIRVTLIENCYGIKEKKKELFLKDEWETVKSKGYYMG